ERLPPSRWHDDRSVRAFAVKPRAQFDIGGTSTLKRRWGRSARPKPSTVINRSIVVRVKQIRWPPTEYHIARAWSESSSIPKPPLRLSVFQFRKGTNRARLLPATFWWNRRGFP